MIGAHDGSDTGTKAARPPGPSLVRLVTMMAGLDDRAYTWLPELARRYGDVASIPVPVSAVTMTLVSHPDHVDHVMTRHHGRYPKHESTREWFFGEPPPLPLLVGDEWRRTRRELNPYFGESALAAVCAQLVAGVTERVGAWTVHADSGEPVRLQDELGVVVMDGLMRSMFSTRMPTAQLRRFVVATKDYDRHVMSRASSYLLPSFVPRPFRASGEAAKRFMFDALDELIARRRREAPRQSPDVLDVLLGMSFPGTAEEQYVRMRSELFGLVLAGVGTTTVALGWTVALLFANPTCLARARAEVDALQGAELEYRHLERLAYVQCCFDEAQRLQAAAPAIIRTAAADDEIGGYAIPAGSHVLISPYGLHHDPRFWTDPQDFRPSRFLDDKINRNAYVPFNVGPRKCMGYRLANSEAVLTVAAILRRYEVTLRPGWKPRYDALGAAGLAGGLPVTLSRRGHRRPR